MAELEDRLARLKAMSPLEEEQVDAFLFEAQALAELGDRRAIGPLLMLLDDRCPLGGVMLSLSNTLESFDNDDFVSEFLEVLPALRSSSPFLCENEVKKLLWSEQDGALVRGVIRASVDAKQCLRDVLDEVSETTESLRDVSNSIIEVIDREPTGSET